MTMKNLLRVSTFRLAMASIVLMLSTGCASLLPKPSVQPTFYSLDRAALDAPAKLPTANGVAIPPETAPTLVINPPRAAAGFDSQRIIYTRESHQLEYFAHNEWIDTPARMLAPLIVASLSNAGTFRAVIPTPSLAAGDIKLDTEIVRLQQVFGSGPSRVQFTLRAYLVDSATRRVLAWREFDETVTATSEDPRGGVDAANRAVQNVLRALSGLCIEAAGTWQSLAAERPARKP
jgi:cholesterol transport system auxiliary component